MSMNNEKITEIEFSHKKNTQYNATWLSLFPDIKEVLLYFNDIVDQTSLEFTNFLNKKFPNIEFLNKYIPENFQLNSKLPLSKVLYHCYPILYGLQQNSENNYQKLLQGYLAPNELPATVNDEKEKITAATLAFQCLANTKDLPPLSEASTRRPNHNANHLQMKLSIKQHIQKCCLELINILETCKALLCTSPKENSYLAGIIYRLHGFSHFIEKKIGIVTHW